MHERESQMGKRKAEIGNPETEDDEIGKRKAEIGSFSVDDPDFTFPHSAFRFSICPSPVSAPLIKQ